MLSRYFWEALESFLFSVSPSCCKLIAYRGKKRGCDKFKCLIVINIYFPVEPKLQRMDLCSLATIPAIAQAQTPGWQKHFDANLQAPWSFVPKVNQNINYYFIIL